MREGEGRREGWREVWRGRRREEGSTTVAIKEAHVEHVLSLSVDVISCT